MPNDPKDPVAFDQVFTDELAAINFRRREVGDGRVAAERVRARAQRGGEARPLAAAGRQAANAYAVAREAATIITPSSEGGNVQTSAESNLTGLALSGGGIRSASFSLGVLQALDSLAPDGTPQVIDAIDYLSTVSGGGYIGTSLVAGLMDGDHAFPFASKLDSEETPEVQHLRDFSNFLAPNGFFDLIVGFVFVLRGLLINALVVLPFLLLLAAITVVFNPTVKSLTDADIVGFSLEKVPLIRIPGLETFSLTVTVSVVAALILVLSAFFFDVGNLRRRERFGQILAGLLVLVGIIAFFETQPFVLKAVACASQDAKIAIYPDCPLPPPATPGDTAEAIPEGSANAVAAADTAVAPDTSAAAANPMDEAAGAAGDGPLASLLSAIGYLVPKFAVALAPIVLLLVSFGQKLANVLKATIGDDRWQKLVSHYGSQLGLYVAGIIVPLVMWIIYLYLCLWAVQDDKHVSCGPFTPRWLADLTSCTGNASGLQHLLGGNPIVDFYAAGGGLLLVVWLLLLGPNVNSMHRYYRDRLSRAFLLERDRLGAGTAGRKTSTEVDTRTFQTLKPLKEGVRPDGKLTIDSFDLAAAFSPYLLVNTTINIEGSEKLNRRGRNADTFLFSPLYVGSQCTKYAREPDVRAQVPELTLGTAMAVSGAAASANMGRLTIKVLTFSLALLNIRLGYWLANPGRINLFGSWFNRLRSNVGLWYFGREALGNLDERGLNVYLTDGGHVENLGVYELLRRRCKVIIAVDVDLDPLLNFPSLVGLEMMARIDLGTRIEVPWLDIQATGTTVTDTSLHGGVPDDNYPGHHGPHAAIGIVRYDDEKTGVLIHIKTTLTGDENDYILDYKRRNPSFPHETTLDQFFSEEQFEVYRALGFHAARQLFCGADGFAQLANPPSNWKQQVGDALRLLNVPEDMIARVVARIRDDAASDTAAIDNVAAPKADTAAAAAGAGLVPAAKQRVPTAAPAPAKRPRKPPKPRDAS